MSIRIQVVLCTLLAASSCHIAGVIPALSAPSEPCLREEFQQRYESWRQARQGWIRQNPFSSDSPLLPEGQALIDMGAPALPFLMEKTAVLLDSPSMDNWLRADLRSLIDGIILKRFADREYPDGKRVHDHRVEAQLYLDWWREGRQHARNRFAALYDDWDRRDKQGHTVAAEDRLESIRDMGIEALPFMIEKIRQGDARLIPFVSKLMRKQIGGETPTDKSVLEWWEANKSKLTLPPIPPVPAKSP